jgi:hypothetical protein
LVDIALKLRTGNIPIATGSPSGCAPRRSDRAAAGKLAILLGSEIGLSLEFKPPVETCRRNYALLASSRTTRACLAPQSAHRRERGRVRGISTLMTSRNRAADARLLSIERALQKLGNRLRAAIRREDDGDAAANTMPIHDEVARLVGETAELHPMSDAGMASKARIVLAYYGLAEGGRAVLHSLVADLHVRSLKRRL